MGKVRRTGMIINTTRSESINDAVMMGFLGVEMVLEEEGVGLVLIW